MDINRDTLARQLKQRYGYTLTDARAIIDDLTQTIMDNLRAGNSVSVYGFGCFDILERQAHVVPNLQGGGTSVVPAHFIPRFYPGKRMRDAVKEWDRTAPDRGD